MKDFAKHPDLDVDADGRLFDRQARELLEPLVGTEAVRRSEGMNAARWLMQRMHQYMQRSVERYGLTEGRLQVLMRLRHRGDLPLGELAELMRVSPRNVTGLVDHLERDGLVARVPDPNDRRSVRAHITEKGEQLVKDMFQEFMRRAMRIFEGIPQEDLDRFRHMCLLLVQRIGQLSETADTLEPVATDEETAPASSPR
ncbi:MAG: MarR family transcriptional regulator [bacterium]|nr:MarR family transcriptional regulator [bacterium]